jgi:D-alanyl-D-alanine carboxypeptidase
MSNSAADGVRGRSALDGVVAETAAGRLLPGVHRCLLRVETPHWPGGWTAAATSHHDDQAGLDAEVAFRIASVTKMMTATVLLALAEQGRCQLEDPTGRYLPSDLLDRFRDSTGRAYGAGITLRHCWITPAACRTSSRSPDPGGGAAWRWPTAIHPVGSGRPGGGWRAADLAARHGPRLHRHWLPAGRAHHPSVDGPAAAAGVSRAGAGPGRLADTWLESSDAAPRRRAIAPHDVAGQDITGMDPTVDWAGGGLVSTAADLAAFLRALTRGQLVSADARREMTRWQPGPAGYYDDYGLGLGR